MSNRPRTNEDRLVILKELLKEGGNRECIDCGAKGPQWASWSLGVFICINCAGIHRSLGTHLTKVKSATLDKWTDEQLANMQSIGNARAKGYYESSVPDSYSIPREGSSSHALEHWIRAKYEKKQFIPRNNSGPPQSNYSAPQQAAAPSRNRLDSPPTTDRSRTRDSHRRSGSSERGHRRSRSRQETVKAADLLNFGQPTQTTTVTPSIVSTSSAPHDDFSPFVSAPPVQSESAKLSENLFTESAFASPTQARVSKDSIMSLYQQAAPAAQPMNMGMNMNMNMNMGMPGMMPFGAVPNPYGQQQMYGQPMAYPVGYSAGGYPANMNQMGFMNMYGQGGVAMMGGQTGYRQ
eukprot:TRINITY_DN69_c0_g1_i1.p1 TRINITY_DN69_c0_g1~~TRINITY_DN69_c0_g1_i1.p1  ORF type:complete len:350 (-),score=69.41 TRINITY_DN69_c0_g1_i1:85-1134(-)